MLFLLIIIPLPLIILIILIILVILFMLRNILLINSNKCSSRVSVLHLGV